MDKTYSFPRVALLLAITVLIGLAGAKCTPNDTGDTNPRPNCGRDAAGNIDCKLQTFMPSPEASK